MSLSIIGINTVYVITFVYKSEQIFQPQLCVPLVHFIIQLWYLVFLLNISQQYCGCT